MIAQYLYYLLMTIAWIGAVGGTCLGVALGIAFLHDPSGDADLDKVVLRVVGACFVISVLTWPFLKVMGVLE